MNRSHQDTFRPKHPPGKDLSTPHLRALRKELLMVRADVERAELLESYTHLRESVTHFSWLRFLMPRFGKSRSGPLGATFGGLIKQYPILGSLLSLVLAKPLRTGVVSTVRPLIKWGGLAFTAWEAYRVFQQIRRQREPDAGRPDDTAGDSTG